MNKFATVLAVSLLGTTTAFAQTAAPATASTTTSATVAPAVGSLTAQSFTQVSAGKLIGADVHNAADESIGEVSDVLVDKDSGMVTLIVGVGGFLGIGEKDVAVPMNKITIARAPDRDDLHLTTMETKASLEAAPAFKPIEG
jgi:sporulation protein YlmC with PRC-barrel domain